jgi:hypothetical protein
MTGNSLQTDFSTYLIRIFYFEDARDLQLFGFIALKPCPTPRNGTWHFAFCMKESKLQITDGVRFCDSARFSVICHQNTRLAHLFTT